jgi:fumarate reductase flavoprotein subunit
VPRHKIILFFYGRVQMKRTVFLAGIILAALTLVMVSCASSGGSTKSPSGTASAAAQGFGGSVTVTVTIEDGRITSVEAEGPGETQGIGSRALDMLPGAIVSANSADVDGISGSSITSQALKAAAKEAISKIGG